MYVHINIIKYIIILLAEMKNYLIFELIMVPCNRNLNFFFTLFETFNLKLKNLIQEVLQKILKVFSLRICSYQSFRKI